MKCEICGISEKKYRCPVCLIFYCSKDCFGNHKESCTKKSNETSETETKKPCIEVPTSKETIYAEVHEEKLAMLRHSEPLKHLLKNHHLRNLLRMIDDCPDPETMMHKAMQEPLFIEYVDVCMDIIKTENS